METIRRWFATASMPVKVFMGISLISGAVVINRAVINPYFKRKKYRAAEEWANKIFEQEEKESDGTNSIYHNRVAN